MNNSDIKILFASGDGISLLLLEHIHKNYNLVGVLGSSGVQEGRKKAVNTINEYALKNNIPLLTPAHLLSAEREEVSKLGANFLLSFSYAKIFGPKFLALFPAGTMNVHPSPLPKYRGPSPLQTCLLNGDDQSAISYQQIALKMDEGALYHTAPFNIDPTDDIITLRDKVSFLARDNFDTAFSNLATPTPQSTNGVSYTSLIPKDAGKINWQTDSASTILRKIKAYKQWPRTWCFYNGKRLYFESAEVLAPSSASPAASAAPTSATVTAPVTTTSNQQTADQLTSAQAPGKVLEYNKPIKAFLISTISGTLLLKSLTPEGKNPQQATDFHNGQRTFVSSILE